MKAPKWIVVLGASAGGVEALRVLLGSVRADLEAAFLVVLHIPPHSPSHLDQVLQSCVAMPVSAPRDKERLKRGHVYVATADQHLMLEADVIRLTRGLRNAAYARPSMCCFDRRRSPTGHASSASC